MPALQASQGKPPTGMGRARRMTAGAQAGLHPALDHRLAPGEGPGDQVLFRQLRSLATRRFPILDAKVWSKRPTMLRATPPKAKDQVLSSVARQWRRLCGIGAGDFPCALRR